MSTCATAAGAPRVGQGLTIWSPSPPEPDLPPLDPVSAAAGEMLAAHFQELLHMKPEAVLALLGRQARVA